MIAALQTARFRVISLDTFEAFDAFDTAAVIAATYPLGHYSRYSEAAAVALTHGGTMNLCFVLDDAGKTLFRCGEA